MSELPDRVLVLGLARSGRAAALALARRGATVVAVDRSTELDVSELAKAGIELRLGLESVRLLEGAGLLVKSPGVPSSSPLVQAARKRRIPVWSEVELASRLFSNPLLGVTGTNGKKTTTELLGAFFRAAGRKVEVAGNVGRAICDLDGELDPESWIVCEFSSFQLEDIERLRLHVAVLLNVEPDHLDRHGSLEAYRRVKRRLAELVDPDGALVLNMDDPVVSQYASLGTAAVVPYSRGRPHAGGLGLEDGWIVAAGVAPTAIAGGGAAGGPTSGVIGRILPISELAIPGEHNVSNALAAVAAALLFGVAPDAIRGAAATFTGVEHRLEQVAIVDGVRFINDSQGTQPDAVIAALHAFPRPLVLIAGGRDKGVDLSGLGPVVAEKADAAVLIGESGYKLATMFGASGMTQVELATSLERAVIRADQIARDLLRRRGGTGPATVLLSPAAASFDMFVDYADRGRAFKAAVAAVAARRRAEESEP